MKATKEDFERKRSRPIEKKKILKRKSIKISIVLLVFLIVIAIVVVYIYTNQNKNIEQNNTAGKNPIAILDTSMGVIKIELYKDKAPITAGNFINLSKNGFYDGLIFHRVIQNFMIQGGDPNGDGTGGPSYTIKDEFHPDLSNVRGTISMANHGPNTGGSQFFINVVNNTYLDYNKEPLEYKHAVFGKVIEGMDVVDAISKVKTDENDKPLVDVVIKSITIQEK
ncbi:MAG: peptidylprolyl isomerase [Candidatus Thermoplasmatota archaeon]|nr:peptidylprolyl isomerase [Candidatus Thermoplasmatota archaeon]